jgi:lysozyme family protein
MEENFNKILKFTLKHEGGFVDDPNDPGGMTNLGISFRFLKGVNPSLGDINDDGVVDEHDIEEMTVDQASKIYKVAFWDACKCDKLPFPLDCLVFDTGVNMGTGTAIKMLQRSLNSQYNSGLKEDGGFGPKTMAALADITDNRKFGKAYLQSRRDYYNSLAENRPKFKRYLKGWLDRVNDLESFMSV